MASVSEWPPNTLLSSQLTVLDTRGRIGPLHRRENCGSDKSHAVAHLASVGAELQPRLPGAHSVHTDHVISVTVQVWPSGVTRASAKLEIRSFSL